MARQEVLQLGEGGVEAEFWSGAPLWGPGQGVPPVPEIFCIVLYKSREWPWRRAGVQSPNHLLLRHWEEEKNYTRIQTDRRGCGWGWDNIVGIGTVLVGTE